MIECLSPLPDTDPVADAILPAFPAGELDARRVSPAVLMTR